MMKDVLVSIAVCTYNGEQYLRPQLDSLVLQQYDNLEIIVADDCSSDGTIAILEEYQAKYPFFRYYQNSTNLGYKKNFESVISRCTGDYIALSDQDDIWELDKIRTQIEQIGDAALIYHDSAFIDAQGGDMDRKLGDVLTLYQGKSPFPFLLFNCVSGHSILFKRTLLPEIMPFDGNIYHDRWIAFVASLNGGIKLIPKALVKYRQHERSETDILKLKAAKKSISQGMYIAPSTIALIRNYSRRNSIYTDFFACFADCFSPDYRLVKRQKLFNVLVGNIDEIFFSSHKSYISKLNLTRKICFRKKYQP
jgi:glycosyltransferase involved in cell wall biosynthesis